MRYVTIGAGTSVAFIVPLPLKTEGPGEGENFTNGTRQTATIYRGVHIMAFALNHVHLKTPDPKSTADWYVANLGATVTAETANGGFRLDLHGLPLNVTDHISTQTHPQNYGFEHIAIDTDDIDATIADLKNGGATVLEETTVGGGRRVMFFEGPQGIILEVLEVIN